MKKPSIPTLPIDPVRKNFDSSVKECLEIIMGRRSGTVTPLATDASLSDVISKMNEVIDRLQ